MKVFVLLLISAALVGCSPGSEGPNTREQIAPYVDKFVDKEEGVVCYVYIAYGISCLRWQ